MPFCVRNAHMHFAYCRSLYFVSNKNLFRSRSLVSRTSENSDKREKVLTLHLFSLFFRAKFLWGKPGKTKEAQGGKKKRNQFELEKKVFFSKLHNVSTLALETGDIVLELSTAMNDKQQKVVTWWKQHSDTVLDVTTARIQIALDVTTWTFWPSPFCTEVQKESKLCKSKSKSNCTWAPGVFVSKSLKALRSVFCSKRIAANFQVRKRGWIEDKSYFSLLFVDLNMTGSSLFVPCWDKSSKCFSDRNTFFSQLICVLERTVVILRWSWVWSSNRLMDVYSNTQDFFRKSAWILLAKRNTNAQN